jgi:hypothetical protein
MNFDQIVERFINERRWEARAETNEYRKLPSLRHAIRDAALCYWMTEPGKKRHPHQWRIPGAALREAERVLQLVANRLSRSRNFETLHDEIARAIGPIPKIGDLAIYDIAHRIGAYLGKSPRLVHLHRGTAIGARHLGFTGATLDPKLLPPAFFELTPEETEDCLCIFKDELAGLPARGLRRSRCVPRWVARRPVCGSGSMVRRRSC